ncbi:MAG: helix-turn-helix domain-containing protein [Candidatus Omnitrophica bacterium]|nr:helix-turn-helix domain-containing protein [Candidatus Omnitrophota bacterium]
MGKKITVSDVAKLSGLSVSSVNYYTNMGLIVIAEKKGNKRLYDQDDVQRRLKKISEMMNMGYTLRLIQHQFLASQDFNPFKL